MPPHGLYFLFSAVSAAIVVRRCFDPKVRKAWNVFRHTEREDVLLALLTLLWLAIAIFAQMSIPCPEILKPFLNWSFGTVLFGQNAPTANITFSFLRVPVLGWLYIPCLALVIPYMAHREEELFRENTRDWKDACLRSLYFGFAHLFAFVSIGTCLILAVSGLIDSLAYFQGGIERSTRVHALVNLSLLFLVTCIFLYITVSSWK